MSAEFDFYHKWLSIPPQEQPPNHYRLLGLGLFESDPDVIQAAADRQMSHVKTYKNGPQADLSQQLLNEIATAKLCLMKPQKRAEYDEQLRSKLRGTPLPPVFMPPPITGPAKVAASAPAVRAPESPAAVGSAPAQAGGSFYRPLAPLSPPLAPSLPPVGLSGARSAGNGAALALAPPPSRQAIAPPPLVDAVPEERSKAGLAIALIVGSTVAFGSIVWLAMNLLNRHNNPDTGPTNNPAIVQAPASDGGVTFPAPNPELSVAPPIDSATVDPQKHKPGENAIVKTPVETEKPIVATTLPVTPAPDKSSRPIPVEAKPPVKSSDAVKTHKVAVPNAAALAEGQRQFQEKAVDATPAAVLKLVGRWDDAALVYVALDKALNSAIDGGDVATASSVVDALNERFAIDALAMRAKMLSDLRPHVTGSPGWEAVSMTANDLIDEALAARRNDIAMQLAVTSLVTARKSANNELIRKATLQVIDLQAGGTGLKAKKTPEVTTE